MTHKIKLTHACFTQVILFRWWSYNVLVGMTKTEICLTECCCKCCKESGLSKGQLRKVPRLTESPWIRHLGFAAVLLRLMRGPEGAGIFGQAPALPLIIKWVIRGHSQSGYPALSANPSVILFAHVSHHNLTVQRRGKQTKVQYCSLGMQPHVKCCDIIHMWIKVAQFIKGSAHRGV